MFAKVTIVVPSLNQGRFLDKAFDSIFSQDIGVEVFVLDGGSTDETINVIKKWEPCLAGWRSRCDDGQSSAINEGVKKASAPYVTWLNSDDWLLPGHLTSLVNSLDSHIHAPMAYGRGWNFVEDTGRRYPVKVEKFSENRLSSRCIICQPATLIRKSSWDIVGGLDCNLQLALDYDLWWRLYKQCGTPIFVDKYLAVNRVHTDTKTSKYRVKHYSEAISVVRKHTGSVPLRWYFAQPYSVWFRSLQHLATAAIHFIKTKIGG